MKIGRGDLSESKENALIMPKEVKPIGRQHILSLSDYAKKKKNLEQGGMKYFTKQHCYPSPPSISKKEKRRVGKLWEVLNSYSIEECAKLDSMGIKIIGAEFYIDHNDRSWAE